jgi:hypothetical protein
MQQADNLSATGGNFRITAASIERRMPFADVVLRRRVLAHLVALQRAAVALRNSTNNKAGSGSELDEFEREKKRFADFVEEIEKTIALYERRQIIFRAVLEQYFEP